MKRFRPAPSGVVVTLALFFALSVPPSALGSEGAVPIVTTGAATDLGLTDATLTGSVDPNGSEVIGCVFEYGPEEPWTYSSACVPAPGAGTNAVTVSAVLSGLTENGTYAYRLRVWTGEANVYGETASFSTRRLPRVGACAAPQQPPAQYHDKGCTEAAGSGLRGHYDWTAWPVPDPLFSVQSPELTFYTPSCHEECYPEALRCENGAGLGSYSEEEGFTATISFARCNYNAVNEPSCTSAGQVVMEMDGHFGVVETKGTKFILGTELVGTQQRQALLHFQCGERTMSVSGAVIAQGPTANKMQAAFGLKLKASSHGQVPEKFRKGKHRPLLLEGEYARAAGTVSVEGAEPIEIRAVG